MPIETIVFSCIALSLAVVGVYGVVAFAANRRTSEIGIRMALGAKPFEVRRLVVKHGLAPVAIGVVIAVRVWEEDHVGPVGCDRTSFHW